MNSLLEFFLLGLGAGAMYALLAQGLVLIYRGSAVVNFAQGAIGALGAYTVFRLRPHVATPVAVLAGVAVTAAVGLAVHVVIMAPMMKRGSSPLARVIATLGVLSVIEQAPLIHYGGEYASLVPASALRISRTIIIGSDRLWLLGIGAVLTAVLAVVYRTTRFGMATTASTENPVATSALGWSPNTIMAINWTAGGALAGFAAIFIAPLTGLSPSEGSLLVVPALAAAMVGNFSSFPLTLLGGLLIGILESESAHFFPSWTTGIPFLVIIGILILRGRALPLRGFLSDRLPSVGTGRVRPAVLGAVVLLFLGSLALFSTDWTYAMMTSATVGVLCLSLVLLTGYAGQISLAQYAMAGLGALFSGRLAAAAGFPFLLALLVGVLGTIVAGLVVGLPAVRVRGVNLAVMTLALGIVIESVVLSDPNFTGGPVVGTVVKSPHIGGWNLDPFLHPKAYAIVCMIAFVGSALLVCNIRRGRTGRRLLAVRDNERAAASVGVSVVGAKLYAFGMASGLAGLAGVLLAFANAHVNFSIYDFSASITLIVVSVIGGIGYVVGAFIGGFGIGGFANTSGLLQEVLDHFFKTTNYFIFVLGCLLLLQLIFLPDGIASKVCQGARQIFGRFLRKPSGIIIRRGAEKRLEVEGKTLELIGITVIFGSVRAVDDVSLVVRPGEILGLIGPNGAGKTTLIDAAAGFVKPASGRVVLGGQNLTRVAAHRRVRAGMVRSWQSLELFEVLTVGENLLAAAEKRDLMSYLVDLVHPGVPRTTPALNAAIDEFELNDILGKVPADLSYAQRHLVGIARAISSRASILLLDEPAAGLDSRGTEELVELLRRLAHEWGVGILLVEHDVPLVMKACDRVVVLEQGRVLAEGTPAEMRGDRRVIEAYLGVSAEDQGVRVRSSARAMPSRARVGRKPPAGERLPAEARAASGDGEADRGASRSHANKPAIRAVDAAAGYGKVPVLEGLNLTVWPGEVVALLGANGAGKTTTLRMLAGVIPATRGAVEIEGIRTQALLHRRVRQGLGYVTEDRSVFRTLTAGQNLRLGRGSVEAACEVLPQLRGLLNRRAGVLSGGEQQMLTLARSLAGAPKVLLADELSLGLAPTVVARLYEVVRSAADDGLGVLLVEQQIRSVMPFSDRAYVLRRGRIVMTVTADEFISRLDEVEQQYLGGDGELAGDDVLSTTVAEEPG